MKKFFYSVLAAATMLFATTSCSQEEEIVSGGTTGNGNTQKVTFSVQLPDQTESRSIANGVEVGGGNQVDKLIWALYEKGKDKRLDYGYGTQQSKVNGKHEFTADISLVKGLTYNILFFAYDEDGVAFQLNETNPDATDLTQLKLKTNLKANQEGYDAFVKCHEHTVKNGNEPTTVTLTRPFAQVNAATTVADLDRALTLEAVVTKSELIIKDVPTQYNVLKGEATATGTVTYGQNAILMCNQASGVHANEDITVKGETTPYKYLTMAYVLAGETSESSTHNATFNFYRDAEPSLVHSFDIEFLPIQRNWRTNVIGNLLTETESFKIVIDEKFVDEHIVKVFSATYSTLADMLNQNVGNQEALTYNVDVPGTEKQPSAIITIPDNTAAQSVSFNLMNLDENAEITITNENEDNTSYDKTVYVEVPENVSLDKLTINLPDAHVVIKQGNYTEVIAATSNTTLEIPKGVQIGNLTIDAGNAEIYYGAVTGKIQKADKSKISWFIDSKEQLAALANEVNSGKNFATEPIYLVGNIDLNNDEWAPIGTSSNPFKGTFDGQGHTISNLKITSGNDYVGLFGFTTDGEIKNLTVENAKVKGRVGTGVVAGSPYTSKYNNIIVKGHVEVDGMSYVGTVGGRNAYANWNNITVDVDDTSYVNANSVENGTAYRTYVGGVIGFMGEGGHKVSNVTSNIDVKGSTIDVGGIVGIAHYSNKFENVTCNADVEIYAASEEADAQEIGGIAGVWHNETGHTVTFTNCKFTGELKANNDYVINTQKFGNLVCAAYNTGEKATNGKLIIDGVEYVQNVYGVIIDGVANVDNSDDLAAALANGYGVVMTNDIKIEPAKMSNAYGKTGLNVKNGQTIDGGGYTLNIKGAGGTWDSGINTTGGLIKNIKVTGSFRGIFINHNSEYSDTVVLENVTIEGTTYTISCDQGKNQNLKATKCTFNGWTSYAKTIGEVKFTECSFGEGSGYKFCRPYAKTEFIGCNFCEGYKIDPLAEVSFKDCKVNGVALTAANLSTLVTSNIANASVK